MMDMVLQAIAEPRRREILILIRDAELSAGDIAARFDVTRPAISQHLQVLAGAGLVNVRKDGTRRLYQARPEGLEDLRAFLESFWDDRLLFLKQAAESEQRRLNRDDTATG
jgi:DNA-binding transcriptional ArsR family regulator